MGETTMHAQMEYLCQRSGATTISTSRSGMQQQHVTSTTTAITASFQGMHGGDIYNNIQVHSAAVMSSDVLSGPVGMGLGPVTGVSSSIRYLLKKS